MAKATQSVELTTLLSSIRRILSLGTGIDTSLIRHWITDDRPRFEGQSVLITYRLKQQVPQKYAGANRRGFLADQILQIFVYVRYAADVAGSDIELMSYDGRGYYRLMAQVIDSFQGLNIFSLYEDDWQPNERDIGLPDDSLRLTIVPCQMTETDNPSKPRSKEDQGWAVGQVEFELKLVQPLSL